MNAAQMKRRNLVLRGRQELRKSCKAVTCTCHASKTIDVCWEKLTAQQGLEQQVSHMTFRDCRSDLKKRHIKKHEKLTYLP
jgi:hypothetical protein